MVLDQQTEGCSLPESHFLLALPVNSHWRFFKRQIQHMLNCDRWSTQWHNGWLGLWLLDQASGAGGLWSGKDHLPPQVHRQQVQPQVHDHRGHRLQRKTSGEWRGGCNHLNPKCSVWPPLEIRGAANAYVQMYTGTGVDGMTERNFRIHLQLWDTAGQER